MSVRWQHCIDHADKIQKTAKSSDYPLGVVPHPTDSRLNEINTWAHTSLFPDPPVGTTVRITPGGVLIVAV